ncbi:hypothetical protein HBI56_190410 [Parastagonospora nodorum]|uniref:FAD-binding PCMH-type domain-containing protein n=1 Tax=Phaeosphaeria nodorum (strain SN15 / ATCC MYA-4574 / FGSC 10173) TaxID=321614 RepID=A0A7U2FA93_PHANO|nr:hypothetical protein HBH56_144040 [Parastagonospora nodorum]QRD01437.1 hypothetical protein JI435_120970 [Parastagonospora nodorum SN15]KAH3927750.1 hypothetical protein HBH54_149230 [Parastagonospora nodorum]KAH3961972.1 hypothetical protein HBH51_177880 [Parastagonospora nodorum]KAH3971080.1 hypothetical protein HBH52_162270 [Parastagonospora nodorum]
MIGAIVLLAAVSLPFVRAQNETMEEPTEFLYPQSCCAALATGPLKAHILHPGHSDFDSRLRSYFDVKQQSIKPSCIVQPRNTEEVSTAVKVLSGAGFLRQCGFAIRSGGHTPYAGASNIEDGVTIDLQYISSIEYNEKSNLVKVGPGASWHDVFATLEPLGVITTGGRSATVGVGGLTLVGGISYFTPEHGLICDNVLEFEVVLADGRVVTASQTSNSDLFTVLKGGGNNFGVVTALKFRTFPYKGMWGGLVTYLSTTIDAQFKALANFANNMDKDVKGAVIVMPAYMSAVGIDLVANTYDYADPVVKPPAYDEFMAIPGNISDATGLKNMSTLAKELEQPNTYSVYFGTLTFANDLRVLTKSYEIYVEVLANLKAKATGDWGIYTLYQPLAPAYWRQSAERGGNVLGLDRFGDQVLCLYQPYIYWQGSEQDTLFQTAGADLVKNIRAYAESIGADNPYLYMGYADKEQDPLASYGPENVRKMKAAAQKYDPDGVFQKLVPGGFKISKVQ